jgi:Uma2 family endonuclease
VARVQTQTTIEVATDDQPTNRPEPDALVLARPDNEIEGTPAGGDLALVAEVSDATLRDDLHTKAALYARADIPEYWVLDVPTRRLFVHRNPVAGNYAETVAYAETDTIAPLAAPEAAVRIADLLPPSAA